ncbi:MAG: hypothetical protein WA144_04885 [Candidatus Methanoperedens sp.]
MGLKETIDEINKKPNAAYYYIAGILAVLFTIGLISNPKAMGETVSMIVGIIFWLIICYVCFKYFGRNKQQQQQNQQQQQQIVVQTGLGDKKVRVCPKCGMQNDVTNKFCSDCANEFKKSNN